MDANFWSKRQIAARKIDIRIPSLSTVVLSLLGFTLMSYLTVRDFLPLLKEYRYNNQDTNVEVILLDPNFTIPQISLNIPHYKFYQPRNYTLFKRPFPVESDCFYKTAANLKSGVVTPSSAILRELLVEYENEPIDIFYNALALKLVKMILNESKTSFPEVLRDFPPGCRELKPYPEPATSWKGISTMLYQSEPNGSGVGFDLPRRRDFGITQNHSQDSILSYPLFVASFNFFNQQCGSDYHFEPPDWGSEKLDALHASLMKKSTRDKLEWLFALVLKAICQQTKFSEREFASEFAIGHDVNRTCENVLSDSKRAVLFDDYGLWFTVQSGDHSPKIEMFEFEFALHEQSMWASSSKDEAATMGNWNSRRFSVYADASAQYVSTLDQLYASYIYQTPPIQWGDETYGRKITIKYSVQNRARKGRDQNECRSNLCFDESSVAQCRLMCTKQQLIDGPCGCVPFSFRRGLKYSNFSTPFCDADTYAECGVRVNWDVVMAECEKSCQDACDYTSYSFQFEYEQFEMKTPNVGEFELIMFPVFNSFTQFTWSKKTTEEQFFAQLAGIANLYLGYSGLSVIAGLSYVVEWIIGRWRKRHGLEAIDKKQDIDQILELTEKKTKELMESMKLEMERNWKRDLEYAMTQYR